MPTNMCRWSTAALAVLIGVVGRVLPTHAQFSFDPALNVLIGDRPDGVAAADFDGDMDIDLAITSDNPDKVTILINGSGAFNVTGVIPVGGGTGAGYVAAADPDGDGDADLAVSNRDSTAVSFFNHSCPSCALPGDADGGGVVDCDDVQGFPAGLMRGDCTGASCADLIDNGSVGPEDVSQFVTLLLGP